MTEILPFTFPATSQQVRSVVIDGEPWFIGADVTTILGYANGSRDINRHVPERHRRLYRIGTGSGEQSVSVISEPGAYRLIMRSNQDQAEAFQDWLAEDVIPSIRRTGSYSAPAPPAPVRVEVSVNALAELAHTEHVVPAAARILAFARWRKPRRRTPGVARSTGAGSVGAAAGSRSRQMADSPAETIARAAEQLRSDADRAEHKGRSILLDPHEVRPIADWLAFEAQCLAEGVEPDDPASELALNAARALLGQAPDA